MCRCTIPMQKYSVIYGRVLLVTDDPKGGGFECLSESYTGDAFPQTGQAIEAALPRNLELHQTINQSYMIKEGPAV